MLCVKISDAQTSLLQLIGPLESGDGRILLLRNGKPIARLTSIEAGKGVRVGVAKGKFEVPDDIDRRNDDVQKLFSR
ncbi:prevent-host-death protein [Paraburkholderia fungorum]|uniref:type II toxin-antitoxin system Phd/YefM family antitoxin n=1 Tax=Paraburkholderia fungorum TaxID=134537 RepID=UPI0038BCA939